MENIFVHHRTYGRGQIVAQNEKTLRVRFENDGIGEKSFVWPDAFEVYLRYEDSIRQRKIEPDMEESRRKEAAAAAERESERLRALAEAKKQQKVLAAARKKAVRKNMAQSKKSGFSV